MWHRRPLPEEPRAPAGARQASRDHADRHERARTGQRRHRGLSLGRAGGGSARSPSSTRIPATTGTSWPAIWPMRSMSRPTSTRRATMPAWSRIAGGPGAALAACEPSRCPHHGLRPVDGSLQGRGPCPPMSRSVTASATWKARMPSAIPAWRRKARSRPSIRIPSRRPPTCAWCTTARSPTTTTCGAGCASRARSSRPTMIPRSPRATSPIASRKAPR